MYGGAYVFAELKSTHIASPRTGIYDAIARFFLLSKQSHNTKWIIANHTNKGTKAPQTSLRKESYTQTFKIRI